ncbi:MAG TPA: DUF5916 domain-containing protein, partial [Candidatus Paceibacterota bacterium]|nr:DUF5916 domain-containing protein [Verrucomicrobiota bacterium]HRY50414.1 DUF5916 domain-containing protein [Candidatus Paceibacterota bacterium]
NSKTLSSATAKFQISLASPYVSAQLNLDGDTSTELKTGLDVSVRLTPSITTAWTINPDYGQIEADADTIELRDTERFLPEKRPFFREGDELMQMRHLLYYSRRFTDIDGGAKVSGEWNGYKFAMLDVLGDVSHGDERYGNSAVFRVLQSVRERSNLGYYLSDSEFEEGHSRVLGTDGYFYLSDAWRVRFQFAGANEQNVPAPGTSARDLWDYLGATTIIYDLYPWEFGLSYDAISDQFNPALGYIPRQDIFGPTFYASYNRQSREDWYKNVSLFYENQNFWNEAGDSTLRDNELFGRLVFPNDFGIRLGQDISYHDPYNNWRTEGGISFLTSDYWKSVELGYALGEFEEMHYHEIDLGKNFKPFERWPISWDFVVRFEDYPDGSQEVAWLNRVVFDLYLRKNMWIKTSLQHRNDEIHNLSVIYGWEYRKNSWFYFVVNDVKNDTEDGLSLLTKVVYSF